MAWQNMDTDIGKKWVRASSGLGFATSFCALLSIVGWRLFNDSNFDGCPDLTVCYITQVIAMLMNIISATMDYKEAGGFSPMSQSDFEIQDMAQWPVAFGMIQMVELPMASGLSDLNPSS